MALSEVMVEDAAPALRRTGRTVGEPVQNPTLETMRLYAADWRDFAGWCRMAGLPSLPSSPETLAAYLFAVAPGLSRGALGRHRAAIRTMHRKHGFPPPSLNAAAQAAVRVTARPQSASRRTASSLAGTDLERLALKGRRDLSGLRDRALLLLAAATRGADRGRRHQAMPEDRPAAAEAGVALKGLLGLDVEHVTFVAAGVALRVRARDDELEPSRTISLRRCAATVEACPVRALEDWLRASDTVFGPVFRKVDRWGNVEHARLGPDAWRRILARRTGFLGRRARSAKGKE